MTHSLDAELLTAALEIFPAEAALLDADGTILYTNEQWRTFGQENGLVGEEAATIDENYLAVTAAADDDHARTAASKLEAALAGERSEFTYEYPCHSPREKRWFLMTVKAFDYQGDRYLVMGHLDITERKLAELEVQEQNTYLEGLHGAVQDLLQTDSQEETADLAVMYLDRVLDFPIVGLWLYESSRDVLAPAAMTGQSETLIGSHPTYSGEGSLSWEVFITQTPRVIDDLNEVPDRHNPETLLRSEIILPLGEYGVLNIGATESHAFDEMDLTLAEIWAGTVTQVLARLDREAQLRERERELTRERDRLDEFASLVSHDLRNPLNVATGRLELAQEDCDSANLDRVEEALARMGSLIDDLLTLARQGEDVGNLDSIHLPSLVDDCWAIVETQDATLEVTTELTVLADGSRLQQVFENLFRNAIEHGGAGVTIQVGDLDDPPGFFVEDDGKGVPEAVRSEVFESGRSTEPDGTGFGLRIVKDIVEAHGWGIRLEEGADGGARFEITGIETE